MNKKISAIFIIISIFMQSVCSSTAFAAADEPAVVSLACTNEAGDYTYFDNHFCITGTEPGYKNNFRAYPKSNYIKCHRIDYDNPKRRDYIYMEKTTENDCYFDITCTKRLGYTGNAAKRYDYFLIQGDFYTTQPGVECQMFLLRDSTSSSDTNYNHVSSTITTDGGIKSGGVVYDGYKIRRGEWFNYKLAVNLKTHKADIYINDVLVQQQTIRDDIKNLDMVRFSLYKGTGDMYIDNFSVTGLVVPYENGVDTLTDVFPDNDETIMNFLDGKVGMHAYGGLMYKDGVKSVITPKPLYDSNNQILYAAADTLNSAFGFGLTPSGDGYTDTAGGMTLSADGTYTYRGKSGKLSVQPITSAGVLMVPVMEFAKEVLGKYVFFHESGIVVIGDKNEVLDTSGWEFASFRETIGNYTQLNDVDFLNGFLSYVRPDSNMLAADFAAQTGEYSAHPRILLSQSRFDHLKNLYKTDDTYNTIAKKIISRADMYMRQEPLTYTFDDSMRMYVNGANTQTRFLYWGYAYKLTGSEMYVRRAVKELEALDTFPDFNPLHIIDSGMFCMGLAVAYDWFYEAYTEEERELARRVTYEKCLLPLSKAYYGRISELTSGMGTVRWMSNYNAVVSGGALNAAVATIECDPEYNLELISNCLKSLEYTLMGLMPSGGWNEAVSYWNYTQEFLSYSMATLNTAFGTTYGIKESQGMEKSVEYAMSCIGVGGINNYHDAGGGTASTSNSYKTFMYLANTYGKYDAYGMRMYDLLERRITPTPEDGLFYNSDIEDYTTVYDKNGTSIVTAGTELFSIRDTYDREESEFYFSTHFGTTSGYHQHNDCGTFVLDMYGTRFADDLGADDYNLQNELKYRSWELYRYRAEGHNVLVFNPAGFANGFEQVTGVFAPIVDYDYNDNRGFVRADLSDVYTSVNSMKTGYYIDKENMSVTMRSEFDAVDDAETYWFMHTRADIEIDEQANCAYLTRNGHTVCVRFETNGADAQIMAMEAAPFATSPQVPEQNVNAGYRKVAIKFNASGTTYLTVNICGAEGMELPVKNEPMVAWTIDEATHGEDNTVAEYTDYSHFADANIAFEHNDALYGKPEGDTSARLYAGNGTDVLSIPAVSAKHAYTVMKFDINTVGADAAVSNFSGVPMISDINFEPDRWNSVYVIRRNSDGKIITVINGDYGEWQNYRGSFDGFKVACSFHNETAYVDIDNCSVYNTDTMPILILPYISGVEQDGEYVVNASGVKASDIVSGGTVRVYADNSFERILGSSDALADGNVVVAVSNGIYRYYRVTAQPPVDGPQILSSNINSFDSKNAVRATVQSVDDITGAYGTCGKVVGIDSADGNYYFGYSIPSSGKITLAADVIPGENSYSFRFAKVGHYPISRYVYASELSIDRWNRLELRVDIDTGKCDLYINGVYDSSQTVSDITTLRLICDMNKSKISNLADLTVYVDNIVVCSGDVSAYALSMSQCTLDGNAINGAAGMTVSQFINQCSMANYRCSIKVYGADSLLGSNSVIQKGDTVYYYFGQLLVGCYAVN